MRVRIPLVCFLLVLAGSGVARGATPDADIADLRAKFTSYLQSAEQAHTNRLATWRDDYMRALGGASRKLQAAGRAEDAAAIDDELARFRREGRAVPAGEGDVAELAALRRSAEAREQALWRERWTAILGGARKYAGLLEERERKSTEANDLERAMACKEERERAMMDPAVTEAEFELAVMDVDRDGVAAADAPAGDQPAAAADTGDGAETAAAEPASGAEHPSGVAPSPQVKVYAAGQKVPPEDSSAKRLTLVRTEFGPLANRFTVNASAVSKSESKREGDHVRFEEYLDRWYLRLQTRAVGAAGVVENPVVVVQMYIKSAQSQGRVEPLLQSIQRVPLAALTAEPTTIVFPPVETRMSRQRLGKGAVWQYTGKEFYGAIISIFDVNKTLLYQTTTTRGLASMASAEMPGKMLGEQLAVAQQEMNVARDAENAARLAFFADQRNETNREAFVEATRRLEQANQEFQRLKLQAEGAMPPAAPAP